MGEHTCDFRPSARLTQWGAGQVHGTRPEHHNPGHMPTRVAAGCRLRLRKSVQARRVREQIPEVRSMTDHPLPRLAWAGLTQTSLPALLTGCPSSTACHHRTLIQFDGQIMPHTGIWPIQELFAGRNGLRGAATLRELEQRGDAGEAKGHLGVTTKVVVVIGIYIYYYYYDSSHSELTNGQPSDKENAAGSVRRHSAWEECRGATRRRTWPRNRTSPGDPGTPAGCCPWGPYGSWPQ